MSSFEKSEREGHPVFSYENDSNKQFWMITSPPDVFIYLMDYIIDLQCDLSQLGSVKIDFDTKDPLMGIIQHIILVIGKFKIGDKKYNIKENKQVNSNQFLTLLPKNKKLKIGILIINTINSKTICKKSNNIRRILI